MRVYTVRMYKRSFVPLLLSVAIVLVAATVSMPRVAHALGTSFGGRIFIFKPCHIGPMPAIWISIIPAGPFQPIYIWTPATLTFLSGPPSHAGQEILGVADTPITCSIGIYPLPPGQRMQIVGTSPF